MNDWDGSVRMCARSSGVEDRVLAALMSPDLEMMGDLAWRIL